MICEQCHEREAVVHLTQIQNDQVSHLDLCEQCAADRGVESQAPLKTPLGGLIAAMGKVGGLPAAADGPRCDRCGATLQDFRESGRLGCASCYTVFAGHLRELLRRLHGATVHTGERYLEPGAMPEEDRDVAEAVRAQLRDAVARENFELAAELRDRLKTLE